MDYILYLNSPCRGCGRICCTKLWDFSVSWRTWMLSSFLCLCRSPTSCCIRRNSASSGAVVLEVSLVILPAYLLDACTFCLNTTKSCSNLAFSATVSSSFCKPRESRYQGYRNEKCAINDKWTIDDRVAWQEWQLNSERRNWKWILCCE